MLGLFVLSLALAVCQGEFCLSETSVNCTCHNDTGKLLFMTSHHKEDQSKWVTLIKGTTRYCRSSSALELWNKITAKTSAEEECRPKTPSPPRYERPSEKEMTDRGYERQGSSLYKFHDVTKDWENARRTCQSEGAHLAIVNSEIEAKILEIIFARYPNVKNTYDNNYAFVGFHDQFTEGNYLTIFGEPIEDVGYSTWESGMPDNGRRDYNGNSGENCGTVNRKAKLNDAPCLGKFAFICEADDEIYPRVTEIDYLAGYYTGVESVIKPPPGTVKRLKPSSGYRYYPCVGIYKLHTRTETWENARKICESEDAHLAIINSEVESVILSKLFSKQSVIYNTNWNDMALIGFHDQFSEGKFVTIYNETLESTGFTKWWASNEPNNNGASNYVVGEDCGAMHRNGGLNDISCHMRYAFICEQTLLQ